MDLCAYDRAGIRTVSEIHSVDRVDPASIGGMSDRQNPVRLIEDNKQNHHDNLRPGDNKEMKKLSFAVLMIQGIATSIDALSVGFTIAEYGLIMAVVCSLIVAVVTFVICETGLYLGKTLGTKLSGKADVLGGVILIGIGIEIFVKGVFF